MNPQSEIILEKIVDHFGLWEEPVVKNKITYTKEALIQTKKKKENIKSIEYTDAIKQRRNEILISIEELKSLDKTEAFEMQPSEDFYKKTRQEELIYTIKVLKEVSATHLYNQAS